jgi:hypothetical protein
MYKDGGWNNRLKLVSSEGELANISNKLVYAENVNKEYLITQLEILDEKDEWYVLNAPEVVNGVDLGNMIGKKISRITYFSDYGFDIVLCDGRQYGITCAEYDYQLPLLSCVTIEEK